MATLLLLAAPAATRSLAALSARAFQPLLRLVYDAL